MSPAVNEPKPALTPPARPANGERLVVYQHSDLLYWWIVWGYGFLCALLTWLQGKAVVLVEGGRPVLFHPSAWVGISFVALVLFVLVFTNARARGVKSFVLFLVLMVFGLLVQLFHGWNELLAFFPLLLVHMNLAFYLLFSGVLLAAWLIVILGADHFTYWEFAPGSIAKKRAFTGGGESSPAKLPFEERLARRDRGARDQPTGCIVGRRSWASLHGAAGRNDRQKTSGYPFGRPLESWRPTG